jgi:P27 family predicted phage terminase small subunit
MPGPAPKASVLKLIAGETRRSRLRDDRPKINALPVVPPGVVLSPEERAVWDYLMDHVVVPGVHGTADGGLFAQICKLQVRVNQADEKCAKLGLVMKSPSGRPEWQPYARASERLWQLLRLAYADIGCSPGARARIAGPRLQGQPGDANSWDDID